MTEGAVVEERVHSADSPFWAEHRSRYHLAAPLVVGKLVLDVACGAGVGAAILVDAGAAGVFGLDNSTTALEEAAARDVGQSLLCRGDACRLPIPDRAVPVVTSFETIEHLEEPEAFVQELRRVLHPTGVLVLSTPNALHTKPVNGKPVNPFHVREFTPDELRQLLSEHFRHVALKGQQPDPRRYKVCPYWTRPEQLPSDPLGRLRVLAWKLHSRLPTSLREGLSRLVRRGSFYPGEHDFVFTETGIEAGHVLVAICRP